MKPAPFDYVAVRSAAEAVERLAAWGGEAKVLAGGQSLIPVMSFRLAQPAALIDVNPVAELDFVTASADGGLRVGALARLARLERDPEVARRAPLLAEALPFVAHPQIRNRGTVGGSLAHADPAAELPAVAVALDARLRLVGPGGERWVDARDFFLGLFATALGPDELLAEVE
ncbi:MAG TPA: FAD binding domain-containing protein, partial [Thermoanaerobaculia bacterium]|nr:FAD binding domain-containing protein [Thermoanaerobaculia bacterium]